MSLSYRKWHSLALRLRQGNHNGEQDDEILSNLELYYYYFCNIWLTPDVYAT